FAPCSAGFVAADAGDFSAFEEDFSALLGVAALETFAEGAQTALGGAAALEMHQLVLHFSRRPFGGSVEQVEVQFQRHLFGEQLVKPMGENLVGRRPWQVAEGAESVLLFSGTPVFEQRAEPGGSLARVELRLDLESLIAQRF